MCSCFYSSNLLHPQMSVSDSSPSSICMFSLHHPCSGSPDGTLPQDPMPQVDSGQYGQNMGFPRTAEQMMGLGYLAYPSCLNTSSSERSAQQNHSAPQDFSQFLLPPPVPALRQSGQKRGLSKDSVEYRLRRERNNIAVRKSRDKARRRIQLTQQRALQLQDENHRLQMHIQRLSHEVDSLRHYLSQRHLQAKEQDDNC
ncbi:CCAAT/enhancer binding protein (C/EBP) [Pimephales promelas]|nr:CCAAT/enhancer binding protein (C/EBP) [Pimephales promelas]